MTIFYVIRHGDHDLLGRELVGRRAGVSLNEKGRVQAGRLADALKDQAIAQVLSSPRERARETAEPIAARQGRKVAVSEALDEIDFGEWTGRSFAELDRDPHWQAFNRHRSSTTIPGGELLLEVQARIVRLIEDLSERHPEHRLALVSHGDVIRSALLHHLGMPLDFIHRIEVSPASMSMLMLSKGEASVLALNERFDEPR